MTKAAAIHPVMAGTAGHIDHGKSSLVKALTGRDPTRLKEEKERGMTIDLGYAPLRLRDGRSMGMIDVPGHERFVRNMVAGSTGLDLAILVVAADDGVMPQTREHVDILHLLGVQKGVVALTKIDLVDADMIALAADEVTALLEGTPLEGVEIVPVSTITGEGIDELRAKLEELALGVRPRSHEGPFRMPIQRVFQLKGIGTVVTGIPLSGAIEPGADVEFLPGGSRVKVRAVQAFGGEVARAIAGHSTALSVPDARTVGLTRGVVAAAPGIFQSGHVVDIELKLLQRTKPMGHRTPVRFHTGTIEALGSLLLLDRERVEPGAELVARVELEEPICAVSGDRFLLRTQTPPITVGGGVVLRVVPDMKRYRRRAVGEELVRLQAAGASIESRVREEVVQAGPQGRTAADIATALSSPLPLVESVLERLDDVHRHPRTGRVFLQSHVTAGRQELFDSVARMLRDKPLAASIQRASLRPTRSLTAPLLAAIYDQLLDEGRIRTGTHGRVLFLDRLKPLAPEQQAQFDALVAHVVAAGFRPPTLPELEQALGLRDATLQSLLARAVDEGRIEPIGDHYYAHPIVQKAMQAIRRNCLAHDGNLDIPSLRDAFETSRKYLIPLLEHVDGLGLTILRGGVRHLLPSSQVAQELAALDG